MLIFTRIIILLVFVASYSAKATTNFKTIKLAADYWCPYTCDINSEKQGFLIEVSQEIFKRTGILVEYVFMPWREAIIMAKNGEIDGVMGATKDEATELKYLDYPFARTRISAYVLADSYWQLDSEHSLHGKHMGFVLGHSPYGPVKEYVMNNYLNQPQFFNLPSSNYGSIECVKALLDNEVDVIYESDEVVSKILETNNIRPERIKNIKLMAEDDLYIALSPKLKNFEELNQLVTNAFLDPEFKLKYELLLKKYNIENSRCTK